MPRMDFDFNDEQRALRDGVRSALAGHVPHEVLAGIVEDGGRLPRSLWYEITELGWTALLVPDSHGGLGLGLVDMCVVMEEMGRLPLPGPFFSSSVLATLAAARLRVTPVLAELATGESRGTVAIEEMATAGDPLQGIRTRATRSGDDWVLDGLKPVVLDADSADWVLVVARDGDGLGTFLVRDPDAESVPGLDPTRRLARMALLSTRAERVGPAGDQTEILRRVVDDAALMLCAELVGACDATFALATDYAKSRVQFGRPIGTFQAVKHLAADMLRDTTLARVGTHYAAWASDTEAPDREVALAMAKSFVGQAAVHVTGESIQIHGGVGFTWDCDAHLYYKRAKANDLMLGRQGWQVSRLADLLLGPAPALEAV